MKRKIINALLLSTGILGSGSAAAGIELSTNISSSSSFTINKQQLLKGVTFNLSSLNNNDDVMSYSIREDIESAFTNNYGKLVDPGMVDFTFYYGGTSDYQISFVSNNFTSILYFSVNIHSKNNLFNDAFITFDYRPILRPFKKNFNGYDNADIFVDKQVSSYGKMGNLLSDFNKYLESDYVKYDFQSQWKKMGINPDGLSSYNKQTNIEFSDSFINRVNDLNLDMSKMSTSYFDQIPELWKTSLFRNFDSSLKIGVADYYSITSSVFKPSPDKQIHLSKINDNYKNMTLGDFDYVIKRSIVSAISFYTNYEINLDSEDVNYVFQSSYKDGSTLYGSDQLVGELIKNNQTEVWIQIVDLGRSNPLLDDSAGPGFHLELD